MTEVACSIHTEPITAPIESTILPYLGPILAGALKDSVASQVGQRGTHSAHSLAHQNALMQESLAVMIFVSVSRDATHV